MKLEADIDVLRQRVQEMLNPPDSAMTTDDRVRLEILRYTRSMLEERDLGCHILRAIASKTSS
ncbi:hypothetical protein H6F43_03890 [Leptolyngbya sp. FACHB-36]|uniref:hypothetical protein n=1 Tax=Leptolyngbya sp. FACHB-36 TaxID=2692808 RepID=UPI0016806C49|nr:hypothetical protein [Leptolyngbya sp. FACHB-36]MBD2019324.1 hypothetical protein [Leptolyngbya sp. FACHB-36]